MGTSPIRLSGLSSGMDTESMVNQMLQGEKLKQTNVHNKITTLQWTQDAWKNLNTKLYSFYTGSLSKMKMQGSFNAKKATSSDDSKVGITADVTAAKGTHTLQVNKLASSQFVTGAQVIGDVTSQTTLASLGFAIAGASINIDAGNGVKTLNIDDKTTVGDLVNKLKEAGLNASYDTTQKRFFISSKNSGLNNSFTITTTANGGSDLSTLGLSDLTKIGNTVSATNGNPEIKIVQPSDAEIVYNGATLTGSSNQFVVNGLTLTLKQTTAPGETLNLSVTNDTQAIYDSIKGFIKDYNALLNEMNTDYNAPSSKGYDPLTDDQKSAMSQSQIDAWEKKIKDSLLRRDNNLNSITGSMRDTMNGLVSVDGMSYSLASFGIGSVNYTEKGQLHIDGDSDDSAVSGKENKLMKALQDDPEKVTDVFNQLSDKLYSSFTADMKSTSLRSALTFYDDKGINNNITDYQKQLKDMEVKYSNLENRYYKQFSAMEKAMSQMQSQTNALASMLGTAKQG